MAYRAPAAIGDDPSPPRSKPAPEVSRRRGFGPALRLLALAVACTLDRIGVALAAPFAGRDARLRRLARWRARCARRTVAALGALRGVWVKAGQFAAHRPDLVPAEWASALSALRDRVPPLPFPVIRDAVEAELGQPLAALFPGFDPEPLGAASIAQVHRAELPDGTPVAVKVQYPGLAASLDADLRLLRRGLRLLARLAPAGSLDPAALFSELEASLRAELDFRSEARVAGEIAANLADDPAVVVPRIHPSHSTGRVLTMAWHPAVPVSDRAGLARLGVAPADVVTLVARAYARQVFGDGLFHADPHPGNLFVLDEAEAASQPRILFVDFGLSRRLDPGLRRELRLGAYALIQRDADAFVGRMEGLGMIAPGATEGVRAAVEAMFARIGGEGGPLALRGSAVLSLKDEAKELLRETPGLQLPHDLLLFARTLSTVFALGDELAPEVDLMQVTLPYLLRFLAEKDPGG